MAVTNSEGKVVETYNYTPYGELIGGTYSDNISFLYNGQYGVTTDNNGLYYMRARYYNVDIKRFVNQDVLAGTIERISSLNRYSYVEGNPVSFLDPFGLEYTLTDALHEGIASAQQIVLLAQIGLTMVSIIAGSMGNLALAAYSSYYFVILYNFSNVLSVIDTALYAYDVIDPNNTGDKMGDVINGLISLFGIISPIKDRVSKNGFTNEAKLDQVVKSFVSWIKSETAQNLIEWAKMEVE